MSWVVVKGTGRAEYGNYKPVDQTSSGRNTKRPQWYDFQLLKIIRFILIFRWKVNFAFLLNYFCHFR